MANESTRHNGTHKRLWVAVAAQSLLLAAAAAAVLFCGSNRQGSMGIFLCGAGAALVLFPPRQATSWLLWVLSALLAGTASLALLPKEWFGVPLWRRLLDVAPMVPACGSVTPVPAETVFWLAVLGASLLACLFSLGQPVRSPARMSLALAATLACAAYAVTAAYAASAGWKAPFDGGATFGFFPNRNHAATLLVTGCLLGLGVVTAGFRNRLFVRALLAVPGVGVCAWTLIMISPSRAGIVILAVALLVWVVGLGRAGRSWPLVVSFVAISIAAALFLFGSGSAVQKRLWLLIQDQPAPALHNGLVVSAPPKDSQVDPRVFIFQDTLRMIGDFPVTGTGLGTFRFIYPHYAGASLRDVGAIHPESDWLMLASEAGPASLVLALATLGAALSRIRGMKEHPFWPLRWGVICAALAGLLHGFIDVPLHRVELGWWVLVLAGLGLGVIKENGGGIPRRIQHILFVVGGAGMLLLGFRLVQAEWLGGRALPPFAAGADEAALVGLSRSGKALEAWKSAPEAIRRSPMSRELYYQRGVLALAFKGTNSEVDACFEAERLLDPKWPEIPVRQGKAWLPVDPARTAVLWWKAVDRQARIAKAEGKSGVGGLDLYSNLLSEVSRNSAALQAIEPPDERPFDFFLAWLGVSLDASQRLKKLVANEEFLASLPPALRDRLLATWFVRGDRAALREFLDVHPDWTQTAWLVRMRGDLADGKHKKVVGDLCARYGVSLELPEPGTQPTARPVVPDSPPEAFFFLWAKQNEVGARRVLQEANEKRERDPAVMAEVHRLRAAVAARSGNWPLAYGELTAHLRSIARAPLP